MKNALFIAGPTASGKSALSLMAAEALNGVIINADSMQVYKDLRIITACPSDADEAVAPHRLYRFLRATDVCSAALWVEKAMHEIKSAWQVGKTPIVIGGTGMYFKVLLDGIAAVPSIPEAIRSEVRRQCAEEGSAFLHKELQAYDPDMSARLSPNDSQRVSRAVEVYRATRVPLSEWQKDTSPGAMAGADAQGLVTKVILSPDRDILYDRCNRRFAQMLDMGAMDEVAALDSLNLSAELPIMRALGVPSLIAHLRGDLDIDSAIADAQMQTRRFAKRQLTWFRNQFSHWEKLDAQQSESNFANFVNKILK